MKTCFTCGSSTFDDMELCYDCMNYFEQGTASSSFAEGEEAALCVPALAPAVSPATARLAVVLSGFFRYELLLRKLEGCSVSVGTAAENAVVIPTGGLAARELEIFYANGSFWAEKATAVSQARINSTPLAGPVNLSCGTALTVGEAVITLLED